VADGFSLDGELFVPDRPAGLVLFAHGSGSSRHSPRNRFVARVLQEVRLATLLFDLLTSEEEAERQAPLRFDIGLLARRLAAASRWAAALPDLDVRMGLFGASTGAAAALVTAASRPDLIDAVVARGGRPDLAGDALESVEAPTLLIVGGRDVEVLALNRRAQQRMRAPTRLEVVPEATHLFEEPGALDQVARLASEWFIGHLGPRPRHPAP
jgi:putative phosphoribosyl transferase